MNALSIHHRRSSRRRGAGAPGAAAALTALILGACSGEPVSDREPRDFKDGAASESGLVLANPDGDAAPEERQDGANAGDVIVVEGRVSRGAECPVLETQDGTRYALGGQEVYEDGAELRIEGRLAAASFCMQGEGTLVPLSVTDAGEEGVPMAGLTADALAGSWAPLGGNCDEPAFTVREGASGQLRAETSIRGETVLGVVDLGPAPAINFDNGMRTVAIENRGGGNLFLTPPAGGTVELNGEMVLGAGREFEKCGG